MRAIKPAVWSLLLAYPFLAGAEPNKIVQSEKDMYEECSAYSQAGMKNCLTKKASESETLLRDAVEKTNSSISKWDEADKYISLAKIKFAEANKEFAKYRQIQCAFLASLSGGGAGNAHEMGRLACTAVINNQRAKQLYDAISNLPSK